MLGHPASYFIIRSLTCSAAIALVFGATAVALPARMRCLRRSTMARRMFDIIGAIEVKEFIDAR